MYKLRANFCRFLNRLGRDRQGSVAVQFGLSAPWLFLMVAAIIEVTYVFFLNQVIEGAAYDAARQIRTGQVQSAADPQTAFRDQLCAGLLELIDCNQVTFDVRNYDNFTQASLNLSFNDQGQIAGAAFQPGGEERVAVVRVAYQHVYATPMVGQLLGSGDSDKQILLATEVFKNEPYEFMP